MVGSSGLCACLIVIICILLPWTRFPSKLPSLLCSSAVLSIIFSAHYVAM